MIVLEIVLPEVISPEQLPAILARVAKMVPGGGPRPVVVSGRMPIWLACALTHQYHPRPWVGTYDPRLGAAVVVQTHDRSVKVGDVVEVNGDVTRITVNLT